MWIKSRHLLGGVLAASAMGAAFALDYLGPVPRPDPIEVKFTRGVTLAPDEERRLSAFVAQYITEPKLLFHVTGYTSNRGDVDANLTLSQERADQVAGILSRNGIEDTRILAAEGLGPANPPEIEPGESDTAHRRRMARALVQVVVQK